MHTFGGKELGEDIYLIGSSQGSGGGSREEVRQSQQKHANAWHQKRYALAISAVVHGDEVGGLASVNLFLEQCLAESFSFAYPVVVFLGNVAALRRGVRYIDGDLNRSFSVTAASSASHIECQRAQVLKEILSQVAFYFDIHQTIRHSPHGFFIFAYHPERWNFARAVLPRQPLITYWNRVFSLEGMCGDQFVNSQGGVAVTLELGMMGFDPWQISLGAQGIRAAYHYVAQRVLADQLPEQIKIYQTPILGTAYTWADVIPYPATGEVIPAMPFGNFVPLEKGRVLAHVDGKPLLLQTSGHSLFPNPEKSSADRPAPKGTGKNQRPYELLRILKTITLEDLPFITESTSENAAHS